ncbi:MAG: hypothetical protein HY293_03755 [Planctomycetes bacterium]|nr:hypothetical protein [Planctomycetota bacterium]
MIYRAIVPAVLALAVVVVGATMTQDAPKNTKEVMALHKGDDSLLKKITGGKGSDEDHKKLLAAYEVLAAQKPSKGDDASWKAKTAALIAAAKDLVDKKAGAADALKKASDCKACHSVHKGK